MTNSKIMLLVAKRTLKNTLDFHGTIQIISKRFKIDYLEAQKIVMEAKYSLFGTHY